MHTKSKFNTAEGQVIKRATERVKQPKAASYVMVSQALHDLPCFPCGLSSNNSPNGKTQGDGKQPVPTRSGVRPSLSHEGRASTWVRPTSGENTWAVGSSSTFCGYLTPDKYWPKCQVPCTMLTVMVFVHVLDSLQF